MSGIPPELAGLSLEQKKQYLRELLARKNNREDAGFPLSRAQRGLWISHRLYPNSPAYNIMFAAQLRADFDIGALERALEALAQRHPLLRAAFRENEQGPYQQILPDRKPALIVRDASLWTQAALLSEIEKEADRPFDLENESTLRVYLFLCTDSRKVLLLSAHHIAVDFWSLDLVAEELTLLYQMELGRTPALPPLPQAGYQAFVEWQRNYLEGPAGEQDRDYWQKNLAGELPHLNLPLDYPRPPLQTFQGKSLAIDLTPALASRLREICRTEKTTFFTLLLSAYQVLLSKYTGQEEILVGSPMAGRNRPEFERVAGCFVNPVVLRSFPESRKTFQEFLAENRTTVLQAIEHQDYPFSNLLETLAAQRDPSRTPLYQASFVWDRPRLYHSPSDGGLDMDPFLSGQRGAPFEMTLTVYEGRESVRLSFQYNSSLFAHETVQRFSTHYLVLLSGIAEDPQKPIGALPLLQEEERKLLLEIRNDTGHDYPRDVCVHQAIEQQVHKTPLAVALISGEREITYQELDQTAQRLSAHLIQQGTGPGSVVGICLRRSPEMIFALLAVLKAGAAYVPLDPDNPPERIRFMVEDSGARAIFTDNRLREILPDTQAEILCVDQLLSDGDSIASATQPPDVQAENLAYVIYTSGSTGKPKGVMLPHRALMNYLSWAIREYHLAPGGKTLLHTPIRFDLTVTSLFAPLLSGGTVVLVPEESGFEALKKALHDHRDLSFFKLTPAHLKVLQHALEPSSLRGLARVLVIGGEALYAHHVKAWRENAPDTRLINEYGPTEAAVGCCIYEVPRQGPIRENLPIGHPVSNTQLFVLDRDLNPVPAGVVGELYIGGDSLARGYLNRPDLTHERFIGNPFSADPARRLYKTGDLARYLPDGNLEYLGRSDHQVKIRGFRIELEEIETTLVNIPGIREALVIAQDLGQGEKRLVAYVAVTPGDSPNVSSIRADLRETLPDYMIPGSIVFLDSFPLTEHGKVNRKALPEPDASRPDLSVGYQPPTNEIERLLCGIWQEVFGIEPIGIQDHFFDLGGASIQSLEVAARAEKAGLPITPEMIFQFPTIYQLAAQAETSLITQEPMQEAETPAGSIPQEAKARTEGKSEKILSMNRLPDTSHVLIESLGVYLPERVVTTAEWLAGCRAPIEFPLEKMTGIRTRRVVGEGEYSIDLAIHAVEDCFQHSRFTPEDVDLVICCNISRQDGPGQFSFEPGSAVKLKNHFQMPHAEVFDLSNACAGLFSGIKVAEAFLLSRAADCVLVVSGEYISHLAETAQKEIEGFLDPRLACLTVGDAGAALLLERTVNPSIGFHEIELFTLGKYSDLCIAKATDREHGGAIMVTDSIRQTAVALKQTVNHAVSILDRGRWEAGDFQHVIMHQTSETALRDAMREINQVLKTDACHNDNTVINLGERGNTASTSHFVALYDRIHKGLAHEGDRIVFGITGSGQVIGTALYTLDDLPHRLRAAKNPASSPKIRQTSRTLPLPGVRIIGWGVSHSGDSGRSAIDLACEAAEDCLSQGTLSRNSIDQLIHSGVYRDEFLSEPAIAAILAGRLEINADIQSSAAHRTFTFDLLNGGLGFLNACHVATCLIQAGTAENILLTASEIENNRNFAGQPLRGVNEVGSALLLTGSEKSSSGFGRFYFSTCPGRLTDLVSRSVSGFGGTRLEVQKSPDFPEYFLDELPGFVSRLLEQEQVPIRSIDHFFPPLFNPDFTFRLAARLGISENRIECARQLSGNYFTSSLVHLLAEKADHRPLPAGETALMLAIGSGGQMGGVLYRF
ncbi:MAG: amino acid adenylation domain-containing protein [Candidatus Omnitrophica bacterium]|nr:amino acid adenylation domain-containing protein [Candidatus Omnitrophota bacterium]